MVVITAFQVGFCGNATLWRISQHKTDDIFFPAIIATLSLVALVVNATSKRKEYNTRDEPTRESASTTFPK